MRQENKRWFSERILAVVAAALMTGLSGPPAAWAQQEEAVSLTDTIPDDVFAEMVKTGAGLFNGGSCRLCHAVGGRGDGRRAPDLRDVEWLHSDGSFEGVLETITWGVRKGEIKAVTPRPFEMFPSGGMSMSFAERQAIAAYVWSLGHGRQPPKVLAQNEFLRLLEEGQVDEALALFARESRDAPESLLFGERAINSLGYEFLRRRSQPQIALEIFALNADLHPESWNVWDSLAEAHMVAGHTERAIDLYEKSLELNPENDNGREKLAELRGG